MKVSIAGITCGLSGLTGSSLGRAAKQRYAAFLGKGPSDLSVTVRLRPPGTGRMVDADDPVVHVESAGSEVYRVERLDNPFEATIDFSARKAEVDLDDNLYCLDSFLRILYSMLLVRAGGLLLHSAAVAFDGRGGLLVGVSEAGKTTLCKQGFPTVLSDELVVVKRKGDGFRAYGTPFWGEFVAGPVREEADVAGLYLLRKGPRHEVKPAALPPALLEVLGCVFFFGPADLSSRVLDLVGELVESRFGGEFYFVPEPDVVPFLGKELSLNAAS